MEALEALIRQEELLDAKPSLIGLQIALSAESTSMEHPAHAHFASRYALLREFVARRFRSLAAVGRVASDLSPEYQAASFVALADGLRLQWLFDKDQALPSHVLRSFLHSVVPELSPVSPIGLEPPQHPS